MAVKRAGVSLLVVVTSVWLGVSLASGASGRARPPAQRPAVGPAHWFGPHGTFGRFGPGHGYHGQAPIHASGAASNLTNPGNNEIMVSTRTHVIFWLPSGFHYSNGTTAASDLDYENTVLKYFQDVGGSEILNTATQYTGSNGTVTDSSTFDDSIVDTNAFPHTGADVANAVTQDDINTEVFNQIGAQSWSFGLGDMYFVFLPENVVDCNDALTECNTNKYCAYHTYGTSGSDTFIWADIPDNRSVYTTGGCGDSNVTGNESADTTLSSVEHEHLEAITDPLLNAWQDSTGGENGDKCNREMGVADGSKTTPNNYLGAGNADLFRIQREWSNAASLVATGSGSGCAASYTTSGSHVVAPAPSGGDVTDTVAEATIAGNPADDLDYTLTFTNPSNQDDAFDVVAADTLPAGVQYAGSGTPTFDLGDVAPHQTVTKTFTAHPTAPLAAGATLVNSATFGFDDSTGTARSTITRTATTMVVNAAPVLTVPGPQSQNYHDTLSFDVSATDADAGDTLSFGASGLPAGMTLTDHGDRTATVAGAITDAPGTYTATITVDDQHNTPVSDTVEITVTKEETTTAYTGPTVILAGASGVTLTASTVEDGSNDSDADGGSPGPVPAETVTLSLGGQSCTGSTDSTGDVSCTISSATSPLGPQTVSADFAGDTYYEPSGDTATVTVFAFPSRGAFVLGDVTAAGSGSSTVTWWADSWWQLNTLSHGHVPPEFKGFAGVVDLPTTTPPTMCDADWTTTGGNSPPPVGEIPSYMGVIVADKVNRSHGSISGDTVHIVVVQTDPGYAPNPMSHGTGTIVGTFC
jgi:hypothetical protein